MRLNVGSFFFLTALWVCLLLTYAWDDVEEVVDLLVHGRGDDFDLREGVGHRVDAHLRHEQRHQQDLVLLDVVVLNANGQTLKKRKHRRMLCGFLSEEAVPTNRTRTAIMAAAPVDTVQSMRMT